MADNSRQSYGCSCGSTVGDSPVQCLECGETSQPCLPVANNQEGSRYSSDFDEEGCILTAEQWLDFPTGTDEKRIVIGSTTQPTIRTQTKNLIEGTEKSFKTSFLLRLMLGLSCGTTVYSPLPVIRARKVLYIHGELSPPEIKERTKSAVEGLSPLNNFFQGRDFRAHLIESAGQAVLRRLIEKVNPDDLVLDPWQSFIIGRDENEYKEISIACRFLDRVIEDHKLTVYLPTHTGKDPRRGTRGHSVLAGWRDTLIRLKRAKTESKVSVTVEPRWAAPLDPFTLKFEQGTLVDPGYPICSFTKQAEAIRQIIISQNGKATRDEVGRALGLGADALRQALKRAADSGAVTLTGEEVTLDVAGAAA